MRKILFFSVLLLALMPCSLLSAQTNITIRGEVENGVGKRVELFRYSDMLTLTEEFVDSAVVEENHNFELKAYVNYPTMVFLQIENYSQSFFVEPGRDYEVYIPTFDWNIDEQKNIFLDPEVLPLEFVNLPENELNGLITNFEALVAQYIAEHRVYFDPRFKPQKRYFDSLEVIISKRAPDGSNEFFNRYKRYRLAEMKYEMHFDTRRHLAAQYIKDQPILYYDDNYMTFFTALFSNSVSKGMAKVPVWRLADWVNDLQVNRYLDSLGTDSLLHNERVRELVALEALQESYYQQRYYDPDKVVQMIGMIGESSKFSEHKVLAQRIVSNFKAHEQGADVPSFVLPDVDRHPVSLDSLKGKWVYISFVRVGDPNCISELETMSHFKDSTYAKSDSVEFVTICCDREFQKMYNFLKNSKRGSKYNWTWLHFDNDFRLLEHFQVVSYPHFLLINPEGQQQYAVTPAPASGFLLKAPWLPKADDDAKPFFLR